MGTALVVAVAAGSMANTVSWVFVPDLTPWVGIDLGRTCRVGELDIHGEFEQHYVNVKHIYTGPPYRVINQSSPASSVQYELRSGRLIPGNILPDGRFVPLPGGIVLLFAEYTYKPGGPHIWNLPGYFKLAPAKKKLPVKN